MAESKRIEGWVAWAEGESPEGAASFSTNPLHAALATGGFHGVQGRRATLIIHEAECVSPGPEPGAPGREE